MTRLQVRRIARGYLLLRMPKGSVCAEIGVHEGAFSKQILDTVEPSRLHLIDPWRHEEEDSYRNSLYGGLGPDGQATMEERYTTVTQQLTEDIHADREGYTARS